MAKRFPVSGLILLLCLNLAYAILPPFVVRVAAHTAATTTGSAEAGATLTLQGSGFAPGESIVATIATPFGQTLPLVATPDNATTLIASAVDRAAVPVLVADSAGAITFAVQTEQHYQAGIWSVTLRGQSTGVTDQIAFTLTERADPTQTAFAPPAPASATPSASAAPSPATPAPPSASPTPTAPVPASPTPGAPTVTPPPVPGTPATGTPALPASPSGAPSPSPTAPPTPSAAPSGSPTASPPAASPPAPGGYQPGAQVAVNSPNGAAYVRKDPSLSAPIVGLLDNGTVLTITGASANADNMIWWPVQSAQATGWITNDLIVATAPSPTPSPSPTAAPSPTATPTPAPSPAPPDNGPGVPPPVDGPAVAPSQLLPTFGRAASMTRIPQEILLGIARVESGFDPRAVGPYLPQFAGTENEHALGMMQFLPSTYRGVVARVDAATGKNLGMMGIWDAESSIYAAAFYLQDCGAPGNIRAALYAYNNADWYVDLILAWAAHYAGGPIPDSTLYDPNRNGPPTGQGLARPQNPVLGNTTRHLDILSPIELYAPFPAGQTWYAGGDGSFYGDGFHIDNLGNFYTVDFNKGTFGHPEEDDGAPVLAVADGTVNNIYQDAAGAWVVELYHLAPNGTQLRSLYVHLKTDPRINPGIQTNQAVKHGTVIGLVGSTGNSTAPHLHFGLWMLQDGQWVSIRPEPMEGQYLQNGGSIVSTNQVVTASGGTPTLSQSFWPMGPSNADIVSIAVHPQAGGGQVTVFVNTARDGSDRGQWLPVTAQANASETFAWNTAPLADGTYRILFVSTDAAGNRTFQGLTADTAVRYTIRRGAPSGSVVISPRSDIALVAPLSSSPLTPIGGRAPIIGGPLRFIPVASVRSAPAPVGHGVAIAGQGVGAGNASNARVREQTGLLIEEATTNLIPNPSFERGTEGWTIHNENGGALTATITETGFSGKHAVRLDNRQGTNTGYFGTTAGDGAPATLTVQARAVPGAAAAEQSIGLAMSHLPVQTYPLTNNWQRYAFSGATGGFGSERAIAVPPGVVLEIDAAQLETRPYATSYADGSLGPGYGWDREPDRSFSGRLPTMLALPLDGLTTTGHGALSFWATPVEGAVAGAQIMTLGNALTLTANGAEATLRWGDIPLGAIPWTPGETHLYTLIWEQGKVWFFRDGQVAAEAPLSDFALPAPALLIFGAANPAQPSANVVIQDLVVWKQAPTAGLLAALAGSGAFTAAGSPQIVTFDTTVALAAQGLSPAGLQMQFSFDGLQWSDLEPFAPTKALTLPHGVSDVRLYVRFIDQEGHTVVVLDRVQVVVPPRQDDQGGFAR